MKQEMEALTQAQHKAAEAMYRYAQAARVAAGRGISGADAEAGRRRARRRS